MRETNYLEFKREMTNSFLKTVSAFSNYGGGKILFGVDDDGQKIGIADPKEFCINLENKINDSIVPQPDYSIEIEDINIVVLKVEEGINKPYMYKSKAYKRNDSATNGHIDFPDCIGNKEERTKIRTLLGLYGINKFTIIE